MGRASRSAASNIGARMSIRAASIWPAGTGDIDLSAAEAARTHPGIESACCSQSPNGMFPNAAGALAPILLDVDFAHLQRSALGRFEGQQAH